MPIPSLFRLPFVSCGRFSRLRAKQLSRMELRTNPDLLEADNSLDGPGLPGYNYN